MFSNLCRRLSAFHPTSVTSNDLYLFVDFLRF
ncbi:unnamed protein product [Acanthoscelides obtectus]|uniref:Uncharacterized protein n=1 Tax=Acanthoscelides obtectus TaxID=200917 RepID=A0A9P0LSL8_ACAOB|nr:unnamed protein product [Acanthoscelides obtectus]CAK1650043.1 hypothetical protein AOBTE_LOCUS16568 [Acanthoscelides obtectus]